MSITPYHAKYFAYKLTKRSSSDSMQKLASALVDAQVNGWDSSFYKSKSF